MARIRTIKPEFWTDDKIIGLPYSARLFFIGLWNFADDYGCLQDKPEQLKLLILPSDDSFDANQMLDLLISCDLVERFIDEDSDTSFLTIKNWFVHQKVDKPTKSKILKEGARKAVIPSWVRQKVAKKYGCIPGKTKECECYFCGTKGNIYWSSRKRNGEPSTWVSFSLELSHFIPESNNGVTDDTNIVLACRNCNRSMGVKNAFDWLFDGEYSGNHQSNNIQEFRKNSRTFASTRDGKEGNGKEGNAPPDIVFPFLSDEFKELWNNWKVYRKNEFKKNYKTAQSEQAALKNVCKLSSGNEDVAKEIIMQSIANQWQGLFELKNSNNYGKPSGSNTQKPGGKVNGEQLNEAYTKFYSQ